MISFFKNATSLKVAILLSFFIFSFQFQIWSKAVFFIMTEGVLNMETDGTFELIASLISVVMFAKIFGGFISDWIGGPKVIAIVSICLFSFGMFRTASNSDTAIYWGMFFMGLSLATFVPSVISLLAKLTKENSNTLLSWLALFFLIGSFGELINGFVYMWLLDYFSQSEIIAVISFLGLFCLPFYFFIHLKSEFIETQPYLKPRTSLKLVVPGVLVGFLFFWIAFYCSINSPIYSVCDVNVFANASNIYFLDITYFEVSFCLSALLLTIFVTRIKMHKHYLVALAMGFLLIGSIFFSLSVISQGNTFFAILSASFAGFGLPIACCTLYFQLLTIGKPKFAAGLIGTVSFFEFIGMKFIHLTQYNFQLNIAPFLAIIIFGLLAIAFGISPLINKPEVYNGSTNLDDLSDLNF